MSADRFKSMIKLQSRALLSLAALGACAFANASAVIGFDNMTGNNGDQFLTYSEDGYDVSRTQGGLEKGFVYGSPVPSIYAGPVGSPYSAEILVKRSDSGLFKFDSVDISTNNGDTFAQAIGKKNGSFVYYQGWSANNIGFNFQTLSSNSSVEMDELYFMVSPGQGTTSVNIDNIKVCDAVPEPASMAVIGAGVAALARKRRKA